MMIAFGQVMKMFTLALENIHFSFIYLLPSIDLGFQCIAAKQFVDIHFIQLCGI